MRKIEKVLDKKLSVRNMGTVLGGGLVVAVVAGVFWHRRAIKRLIDMNRM